MEIQKFIEKIGEVFEETKLTELKPETNFRELEEWSSLTALSVIAMIDEEYGVSVKGEELRKTYTIQGLFDIVKDRI